MKNDERRGAPRCPVAIPIAQHVQGQSHRGFATSLSLSGLYMTRPLGTFVRHSTELSLEIRLPDGEVAPIWASAEVVYDCLDAHLHGTGVRFTAMSARDKDRLDAFLRPGTDGPNRANAHAA